MAQLNKPPKQSTQASSCRAGKVRELVLLQRRGGRRGGDKRVAKGRSLALMMSMLLCSGPVIRLFNTGFE